MDTKRTTGRHQKSIKKLQSTAEEICEMLPSDFHDEEITVEIEKLEKPFLTIT